MDGAETRKRKVFGEDANLEVTSKKSSTPAGEQPFNEKLTSFIDWMDSNSFNLSKKIQLTCTDSCHRIGLIALHDLEEGEELFCIPRKLVISPQTCRIAKLLKQESKCLESESGWVPLLLSLMYEFTTPGSPWLPYLSLLPSESELDLPMFWDDTERERLLSATGLVEAVRRDLRNLTYEFQNIVLPFVTKHSAVFLESCRSLALYKRMVAFVMAYSFTEPEDSETEVATRPPPPQLLPMADMLNHVARNNAKLDWGPETLVAVTTRSVAQGAEVYNTYGELSNSQLLHMYGFCETHEANTDDTAELSWRLVQRAAAALSCNADRELLRAKCDRLTEQNVVSDGCPIVVDEQSILTEDEARICLKVLCQSREAFEACKQEEDGWSEAEADEEEELRYDGGIQKLPKQQQELLRSIAELSLAELRDLPTVGQESTDRVRSSREAHVTHLRAGLVQILQKLTEALS